LAGDEPTNINPQQVAEKVNFSDCSKMPRYKAPLPSPKRLRAGRRNPEAQGNINRSVLGGVRRNKPAPCLTRERIRETQQMGVFQQP